MSQAKEAKTVIVTGAGNGIGQAVAKRLAHDGWRIVASDVDQEAVAATASATGGHAVVADVGLEADVIRLVGDAVSVTGRLDAIVSNAGINANGPLAQTSLEAWNRVLAVNLTATFLLAKAAETELRRGKGAIVTIASTRAHMSEPNTLAYSASKGGVVALTHALAMTLGPDVRVNTISPGWIDTGKWGALKPSDHAQHPVGRVGVPDDIAAAAAYLLSQDAGFVTGAELIIDGGMTRRMIYS
ncbi:MAG: SDR family oxidoreductase [Proteobacteria bacterium]|nr:SDR family oxidoreductase [Pseudomonadota bacterium]